MKNKDLFFNILFYVIIINIFVINANLEIAKADHLVSRNPWFEGVYYAGPIIRSNVTYVEAIFRVPNGPSENSSHYIHYYVLLNVNEESGRYWYQFGFDTSFRIVGGTYDRNDISDPNDDVWRYCSNAYLYSLEGGKSYRFTINKKINQPVIFTVYDEYNRTIWSCSQSYGSGKLILDRDYSVFEEVRSGPYPGNPRDPIPKYSFYISSNRNSNSPYGEINWARLSTGYSDAPPHPPNVYATISFQNVLIQNWYHKTTLNEYSQVSFSVTYGPLDNVFYFAWTGLDYRINIGAIRFFDGIGDNKYRFEYLWKRTLDERSLSPPSIIYGGGKFYLAWRGLDDRLNVMQSYDGQNWFSKVILNEKSYRGPTLTYGGGYVYLAWLGQDFPYFKINLMRSQDGINWKDKETINEYSSLELGLTFSEGRILIAWTGIDNRINIIQYNPNTKSWFGKVTLGEFSYGSIGLTFVGNDMNSRSLYLVWKGGDNRLNILRSNSLDGMSWTYKMIFDERSNVGPSIGFGKDKIVLVWIGIDIRLNFLVRSTS